MIAFTETQRFRQAWLWIGLVAINFVMVLGVVADPTAWSGVAIGLLLAILFYIWRLDTRLDSEGIHYRVFPILPWRTIPWNTIQSAAVSEYSFVGYGIRWSFDGWVYNIAGSKGLRVVYPNKRQITIGTQCPEELRQFLDQQSVLHS